MLDNKIIDIANKWATTGDISILTTQTHCQTRDMFQARLNGLLTDLISSSINEKSAYLLIAIVSEIGNNSFDHNLGNWIDTPGIYFDIDYTSKNIVIADRGQGIFKTIKRVKPDISTTQEALKVAFTEKISGRSPEQRGNGLKFVSKVVQENCWQLTLYSGNAQGVVNNSGLKIIQSSLNIPGVLAVIKF